MSQFVSTIANFNLSSSWSVNTDHYPITEYGTPSTGSTTKTYSLSGLPSNAIIDTAFATSTLGSPYTGIDDCDIDYDGNAYNFKSGSLNVTSKVQSSLASGSVTFTYKFKAYGGAGSPPSASSSLGFNNNTLTVTYHLPISSFSLSIASIDAGQTITANINRADASYTHTVTFVFGSESQQYTGVATSQAFTIPLSWLNQIPTSVSGIASCTVKTYSGSTLMGTAPTQYFTITAPVSVKPTITSLTAAQVSGYWSLYVQGKSKATLTINGAAGAYGSTITGRSIWGMNYSSTSSPYTTGYLATSGTNTFYATVTDSRGRTSTTASCTLTVTAYHSPVITSVDTDRCNSDGTLADEGLYAKCIMFYTWSAIGSNTRTTTVYYRESGTVDWTLGSDTLISTGGNWVIGGSLDVGKRYDIKFVLYDYFTSGSPIANETAPILTAEYITDYRAEGDGVCFGGASTRPGHEVAPGWESYYKDETLDARFGAYRVYRIASDFGFTVTDATTMPQLVSAIPAYSMLIDSPSTTNTGGLVPSQETTGVLRIIKQGTGLYRLSVEFLAKSGRFFRYKIYSNDGGATWLDDGWKEVPIDGGTLSDRLTMPRLRLTNTTDASGTAANDVAFCVGAQTGAHLEFDTDEIMAKANGTTTATLRLNENGGDVLINAQKAWHQGDLKYLVGSVSLTVSTTGTVVDATIDLSSAGFTVAPSVQCTVVSSSPSLWNATIGTPSTTSVVIYAERAPGTGSVTVRWLAIGA